jgi:hypothetical protein
LIQVNLRPWRRDASTNTGSFRGQCPIKAYNQVRTNMQAICLDADPYSIGLASIGDELPFARMSAVRGKTGIPAPPMSVVLGAEA